MLATMTGTKKEACKPVYDELVWRLVLLSRCLHLSSLEKRHRSSWEIVKFSNWIFLFFNVFFFLFIMWRGKNTIYICIHILPLANLLWRKETKKRNDLAFNKTAQLISILHIFIVQSRHCFILYTLHQMNFSNFFSDNLTIHSPIY